MNPYQIGFSFGNTRQMSLAPQPADEFVELKELDAREPCEDPAAEGFSLRPVFSGDAFLRTVSYPVIVEMWEKAKFGRRKRAYRAEFSATERTALSRYHGKFYRWHLVTGAPHRVMLSLKTLTLLQRAVAFFAGL